MNAHLSPVSALSGPSPSPPASPDGDTAWLLQSLKTWAEQGWLRRLDSVFAGFIVDLAPTSVPSVVMAAALLAHLEGRGHSCLRIDDFLQHPDELLGWQPVAALALHAALARLPPGVQAWLAALQASPLVWCAGRQPRPNAADQHKPLVLAGSKLYLRRYWGYEQRVAAQVLQRGAHFDAVDEAQARFWLDRLFPAPDPGDAANPGLRAPHNPGVDALDWQRVACAVALRGKLSVITGGPGTGKTYTAARLLALLLAVHAAPQQLRIGLAAPTGKAAARLKQSIESALQALQAKLGDALPLLALASHIGAARTLHSLLGARPDTRKFKADAAHPLPVDVLIVDEASMIHLEMMAALLEALPPLARVVFLGDKDQLASVEAGAVLGDLCRDADLGRYQPQTARYIAAVTGQVLPPQFVTGGPALAQQTVMLRHSRRFGGPIGQLAGAVNAGDAKAAMALLLQATPGQALLWEGAASTAAVLRLAVQGRAGAPGGYGHYLHALKQRPDAKQVAQQPEVFAAWVLRVLTQFERFRLLCAVREGDWGAGGLNASVERVLVAEGWLSKRGEWYEGRPVMVTRNDAGVGVFNGDIGIALRPPTPGAPLRAYFLDGDSTRSVGVSRLAHVQTAFAMTVHKSQGSEFEHTVLVLPQEPSRVLTRELVYTGITRARSAFTLVAGRRQAFAEALGRQTRRASGLLDWLDDRLDEFPAQARQDSPQPDPLTPAPGRPT